MLCYKKVNDGVAWILTIIDVYSTFGWALPLRKKTGKEVVENLEKSIFRHIGPPKIIQCDNGKKFCNSEMDRLAKEFNIIVKHSRPRHPQSNGEIERFNQTLTRYLQRLVFDVDDKEQDHEKNKVWLKFLNKILFCTKKQNIVPQKILLQIVFKFPRF
jgi:transposase InsO family protein